VNSAHQPSGSTVLFEGGRTVAAGSASYLDPDPGATYGSYGSGKAILQQGVWLCGDDNVTFAGLRIDRGPGWGGQGVASSASCGDGVVNLTIRDSEILNVSIAINSASPSDSAWRISGNRIQNTGDSALLIKASHASITENVILDAGFNPAITYGKHAVYASGPSMKIAYNTIDHFSANGLSMRYRDSLVERNTISGGPIGIAWFQDDLVQGTALWRYNTIRNYTAAGIYIDDYSSRGGTTRECFEILYNTIEAQPRAMNLLGLTSCSAVHDNAIG
jgi:Periplasmic copper-binding protein (NosD)